MRFHSIASASVATPHKNTPRISAPIMPATGNAQRRQCSSQRCSAAYCSNDVSDLLTRFPLRALSVTIRLGFRRARLSASCTAIALQGAHVLNPARDSSRYPDPAATARPVVSRAEMAELGGLLLVKEKVARRAG